MFRLFFLRAGDGAKPLPIEQNLLVIGRRRLYNYRFL